MPEKNITPEMNNEQEIPLITKAKLFNAILIGILILLGLIFTNNQLLGWLYLIFFIGAVVQEFRANRKNPNRTMSPIERVSISLGAIIFLVIIITLLIHQKH